MFQVIHLSWLSLDFPTIFFCSRMIRMDRMALAMPSCSDRVHIRMDIEDLKQSFCQLCLAMSREHSLAFR